MDKKIWASCGLAKLECTLVYDYMKYWFIQIVLINQEARVAQSVER